MRMDLKAYLSPLPLVSREAFAATCETTYPHMRNVAYGKTCGEALAMKIEAATAGAVTCEELRPDLSAQWQYIRATGCKEAA